MAEEKKKHSRAAAAMGSEKKKSEKSGKPDKKKKKVHRMHIEPGAEGGFSVTHDTGPEDMTAGPQHPHVLSDIDQLHQHIDDHFGGDNEQAEGPQPPAEEAGEQPQPQPQGMM